MSDYEKILLVETVQKSKGIASDAALELLVSSHINLIYKIALKYSKVSRMSLDDLIQESYLAFIEAIHIYIPKTELKYFVYSFIRNKIVNISYHENYLKNLKAGVYHENICSIENKDTTLKPFIFEHINKTLTPLEGLLIKWKFGLDNENWYTTEEISKITLLTKRRINQIIHQALIKLRESMEK